MDSKADQPLLEPSQRQTGYTIHTTEVKDYDLKEPKLIEQIEHIELRDADAPPTVNDGGQGETIQVTETVSKETKKEKKMRTGHHTDSTPLTVGLNMFDRDEKNINGQVHIMFDDVLAEPDGTHSFDPIWRGTYIIFQWTKLWMYRFLALVLAVPLAFLWGLLFAIATAINVHLFTPFYKLFALFFFWIGRLWGTLFRELVSPVFESCGRCFSGIRYSRGEYTTVGTNTPANKAMNNVPITGQPTETWSPIV